MKTLSLFSALIFSLFASLTPVNSGLQEGSLVTDFLTNTKSLETADITRPIVRFRELAADAAEKQSELTKDNIQELLSEAKSFKHLVIVTGNHTIVKVTDLENCRQSGSWGTCMPYGEGYISRQGSLEFQQDYLNNIIGIPGSQSRTAYLFN